MKHNSENFDEVVNIFNTVIDIVQKQYPQRPPEEVEDSCVKTEKKVVS